MNGGLSNTTRYRRGRNYIHVGDIVRVRAMPGRRTAFEAKVRAIKVDEQTGEVVEIEVFGGRRGREMVRTFVPERIERVAQSRAGVPREQRR